jgi:ATP-dependent DNA ligase
VDHTRRFADIAAAISKLSARTLVLDGEVAVSWRDSDRRAGFAATVAFALASAVESRWRCR